MSYNERGELMYHDRMDLQIKRLGYRIELGEIEAASGAVHGIRECACVYDPSRQMILFFYTGQEGAFGRSVGKASEIHDAKQICLSGRDAEKPEWKD